MNAFLAALIGTVAGFHAAIWGMYKDAPHEGFSRRTYLRSPVVGTLVGAAAGFLTDLNPRDPGNLVVLFGLIYAVERALAEIYKTFLRQQDQSKYFIPMQFHVLGKVVHNRRIRLIAGTLYTMLLLGLIGLVSALQPIHPGVPVGAVMLVGGLGGWISALGGAWKDAPAEGFQILKFFRSPLLATGFAGMLAGLTDNLLLLTLAATGYTVATTETYKTFLFPSKPRGKFAGKPVRYPDMLRRRRRFVLPYAAIWTGLLLAAVKASFSL
jgi:hypothetical protein